MKNERKSQIEAACSRLLGLADKYERTEVADYEGALHVRCGRKVVAVFDYGEGTIRVNCIETPEQSARVNEVLMILGVVSRAADEVAVDGPSDVKLTASVWRHEPVGHYSDPVYTAFTPREVFTLNYLGSPIAAEYTVSEPDYDGSEAGEITGVIDIEQPKRSWVQDNLRDVEVDHA